MTTNIRGRLQGLAGLAGTLLVTGCATARAGLPLDYRVGVYEERATLYQPAPRVRANAPASARWPVVVVLHGGFWGDGKDTEDIALRLGERGVLAVVPTYRGESRRLDGQASEGAVEFCKGEVDDVRALLRDLEKRADVDPTRIALLGFSHGGCVALRTAAREPGLAAVVTFDAPTDAGYTARFLGAHPFGMFAFAWWLRNEVLTFVGADPEDAPAAWKARSPLYETDTMRAPLVLVHGTDDVLVPVVETCALRDALRVRGHPVEERYFGKDGVPDPSPTPACAPAPPASGSATPASAVQVWYFEGEGHLFSQEAQQGALARVFDFLTSTLSPAR